MAVLRSAGVAVERTLLREIPPVDATYRAVVPAEKNPYTRPVLGAF